MFGLYGRIWNFAFTVLTNISLGQHGKVLVWGISRKDPALG